MNNIFIGSGSGSEHKICSYQSTLIYNFFSENGYNLVKNPSFADYIILNGYPFEEFEEKINLLTINYYLKKYSNKKIILIGSIPAMMPYLNQVNNLILIGLKDYKKFDLIFNHNVSIENIIVDNVKFFLPLNIESLNIEKYGYLNKNIESSYIFSDKDLKISVLDLIKGDYSIDGIGEYNYELNYLDDISGEYPIEICKGCGGYCSYCDIKNIFGFVKSYSPDLIIEKIKRGIGLGYKVFHFIDEDSASYGLDIGIDFAYLLNKIFEEIKGDIKIKIFYFEPGKLEKLFKKINPEVWFKIINFCVPLQTTSQRILKLMNRSYNIKNVIEIVDNIKNINKDIYITTQFIYGFPTETFEEFKDYFRLIKNFDELRFWYYSDRIGSKSINFENKINKNECIKRLIFISKMIEKTKNKIFFKNESLEQGISIFNSRFF